MPRKRTLNRKDYIGDFEEEETKKETEEAEDEGDAEEKDEDEEAEGDAESDEEGGDDEEAPKKPAKKPKKKKAATTTKRTRAPKVVRMKAVWVVYDNASKQIETFPFNQRAEADAFLEQKNTDKKGAFYLQLVKVPFEEK
jgi:hypothetical protein